MHCNTVISEKSEFLEMGQYANGKILQENRNGWTFRTQKKINPGRLVLPVHHVKKEVEL